MTSYSLAQAYLNIQKTFEEPNRLARFFTKKYNPLSPVNYGTTLTLGNSGVVATEYLARYFSHTGDLFSQKYTAPTELTPALLREFVEKVVVHAPKKSSGHRIQRIGVHYNFIGEIDISPEYSKYSKRTTA